MSHELDVVLLDGGPLHGRKQVPVSLRGFAVTFNGREGRYEEAGRNEAGFRIFKWKES